MCRKQKTIVALTGRDIQLENGIIMRAIRPAIRVSLVQCDKDKSKNPLRLHDLPSDDSCLYIVSYRVFTIAADNNMPLTSRLIAYECDLKLLDISVDFESKNDKDNITYIAVDKKSSCHKIIGDT